ncbi:MAG: hypothetical protein ABI354_02630 [Candidatus Saccharimonadales bacterium]
MIFKTQELLDKELDRQDFLKMSGLVVLGVIGLPQFLALLHRSVDVKPPSIHPTSSAGYGARPYGN